MTNQRPCKKREKLYNYGKKCPKQKLKNQSSPSMAFAKPCLIGNQ